MNFIKYEDKIIEYEVRKLKIKHIYISIKNGEVLIKVPKNISDDMVKEIVEKKKKWIYEKLLTSNCKKKQQEYIDGEKLRILGQIYTLKTIYCNKEIKKTTINIINDDVIIYIPFKYKDDDLKSKNEVKKVLDEFYLNLAKKEIKNIMDIVTKEVGLYPNEYKIKKLKRTFGICSSKKNISLNVDLVMYSKKAIKYVVLHEICHLKYMNHSKKFWAMVKLYMDDYKEVSKELRNY